MLFVNQEHAYSKLPDGSDIVHKTGETFGVVAASTSEAMGFPIKNAEIFIGDSTFVAAGTNGYQGGDGGHGGRTYLRIVIPDTYDFSFNSQYNDRDGQLTLELVGAGDWELQTMIESLRFMLNSLEELA